MAATLSTLAYLAASVLFILALRGLSHPETSRQGNLFGMVGMAIAIVATLLGAAAYYVSAETAWGTTPGKRLLGLSVSALDGGVLDRRRALTRHGVRTLSLCLAGIGLLTVPLTGRRQAVHDLLTGTCVLADGSHRPELVKALCALPVVAALGALALAYLGAR